MEKIPNRKAKCLNRVIEMWKIIEGIQNTWKGELIGGRDKSMSQNTCERHRRA